MIYTISKVTKKQISNGKTKATLDLVAPDGTTTNNVGAFDDFPNFTTLIDGGTVEGDIIKSPDGKWNNLRAIVQAPSRGGSSIKAAQERKVEGIKEAQERREEGVKIAATFRDATLLTTAWASKTDIEFITTDDLKGKWLEFRKWLDTQFGSTDKPPF